MTTMIMAVDNNSGDDHDDNCNGDHNVDND